MKENETTKETTMMKTEAAPNGIIGGRVQPYFKASHPSSSYGQPVWICDGVAYGPSDTMDGKAVAGIIEFFRHSYDGEQGILADKFLELARFTQ